MDSLMEPRGHGGTARADTSGRSRRPGWVRLWLLLSSSVWRLPKASRSSGSGSVWFGVQMLDAVARADALSWTQPDPSTVTGAPGHRNQAETTPGVNQGLFVPRDPQIHLVLSSGCHPAWLPGSISPSPPDRRCPGPGCRMEAPARGRNLGLPQPLCSAGRVRHGRAPLGALTLPGARVLARGRLGHGEGGGRAPGGAGQAEPHLQHVPARPPLAGPLRPRHLPALLR